MTGISVGDYRDPERGLELGDLMREVAAVEGVERVRLSSVEVIHVRDSLLDALAEDERICPHLHVPLQSGDDARARLDGAQLRLGRLPARDRAAARARAAREPHDRRDRRLSDRGRGRVRAHARRWCARRASRACTRSASRPGPGTEADRARRPGAAGGEEAPQPRAARPLGGARPPPPRGEARRASRRCWSTRSPTRRCPATAATTRATTCPPDAARAGRDGRRARRRALLGRAASATAA